MTGPPSASWTQLTGIFTSQGLPTGAAVTFGIQTPPDADSRELIADAMGDLHAAIANQAVALTEARFKRGPESTGPTFVVPVGRLGGNNDALMPPNVAYLIHKRPVDVSGRLGGRVYWPGAEEGKVDASGGVFPSFVQTVQTACDTFFGVIQTELGLGTAVIFPYNSSDPRIVGSFQMDTKIATQRRRLRR